MKFKKQLAKIAAIALSVILLAACGSSESSNNYDDNTSSPGTTNNEPAYRPDDGLNNEHTYEPAEATNEHPLVGTWAWLGTPYYVFNADGTGTQTPEMPLLWAAENGVLSICITPDLCGSTCIASLDWYYVIDGNQLTLTSTIIPDMTYTYTRQ